MNLKIVNYLKKTLHYNISKNYRYFINSQIDISIQYFF